jgi:7,8-dihydroneopterin aldolase/epimerase/oxygenase
MYTVLLKNIRLFGYHGVYAGERLTGGPFELDIACRFAHAGMVTALEESVDYEAVYEIVKKRFETATPLLETLAAEMAALIYGAFPFLNEITISIIKLHPPIESFQGSTGVSFTTTYT